MMRDHHLSCQYNKELHAIQCAGLMHLSSGSGMMVAEVAKALIHRTSGIVAGNNTYFPSHSAGAEDMFVAHN